MKRWTIFTCMIAFLFFAVSSWAWYPDQEKDGIKDDKRPEEVKKLMEQGQFGTRADYEPKPGYPWKEDLEKGTVTGEQLRWYDYDNRENTGFYSHQFWRSSLYMNARGYYGGSNGVSHRHFVYNEGQNIGDDNFGDILTYHEGKLNEGDAFRMDRSLWYWPSLEVGNGLLSFLHVKTPRLYKEADQWRYFANRRKVIRLAASDKAESVAGGPVTYDDIGSRTPWEYESKIIGTDVLTPEEYWYGHNPSFWDPKATKPSVYKEVQKPIECWVVESKARDPGYYLGKIIYWFSKDKDFKNILPIREEQYDREMNLWRANEFLWGPPNPEDGERIRLTREIWDLRLDFRDAVLYTDGYPFAHNLPIPGGDMKKFFSLEAMRSEQRWFPVALDYDRFRKQRWEEWRKTAGPKLLRNKFPEHRKIVLRKEVEERIKKLVEKGIFE